jgi:hypothetical protein
MRTVEVEACVVEAVEKQGVKLDQKQLVASVVTNEIDAPRRDSVIPLKQLVLASSGGHVWRFGSRRVGVVRVQR